MLDSFQAVAAAGYCFPGSKIAEPVSRLPGIFVLGSGIITKIHASCPAPTTITVFDYFEWDSPGKGIRNADVSGGRGIASSTITADGDLQVVTSSAGSVVFRTSMVRFSGTGIPELDSGVELPAILNGGPTDILVRTRGIELSGAPAAGSLVAVHRERGCLYAENSNFVANVRGTNLFGSNQAIFAVQTTAGAAVASYDLLFETEQTIAEFTFPAGPFEIEMRAHCPHGMAIKHDAAIDAMNVTYEPLMHSAQRQSLIHNESVKLEENHVSEIGL